MKAVLGCVLTCVVACVLAGDEAPVVSLKDGRVSGVVETSTEGHTFYAYYGLPFAKPPVGELRFMPPEVNEGWEGVRDGSKQPPICNQGDMFEFIKGNVKGVGQEDCLYLNVFTPKPGNELVPVMVFIHGGAFQMGDASTYPPHQLLNHPVVLVTIQYRLGAFGFLSTEDDVIKGNMGLRDQARALKWVQDNIHEFGGDPLAVTIFGESAGAASVHFLTLSHITLGMFQRAIMQSGSALCPWAMGGAHRDVATYMASMLNCSGPDSSQAVLECLRKVDADTITEVQHTLIEFFMFPLLLGPRVDGEFLIRDPEALMKEGRHKKINVISGINRNEGGMMSQPVFANEALRSRLRFQFPAAGPISLEFHEEDVAPLNQTVRIFDKYVGGVNIDPANADNITRMYGDRHFNVAHDLVTMMFAKNTARQHKQVFAYEFNYKGQHSFGDMYGLEFGKDWITHADDLMYLFQGGLLPPLDNEDDLAMQRMMTKLWVNFATTGHPTPDDSLGFTWDPVTKGKYRHLSLTLQPTMEDDTREEIREFWASLPLKQNLLLHPEKVQNLVKVPITTQENENEKQEGAEKKEEGKLDDKKDGDSKTKKDEL